MQLLAPYTVWIPQSTAESIRRAAQGADPLETGGVLVGYWASTQELVIQDFSEPGPQAKHTEISYSPDHDFQSLWVAEQYTSTNGENTYLGDWHSHPKPNAAHLSNLDLRTLERIAKSNTARAPKPIMMIVSKSDSSWIITGWIGTIEQKMFFRREVKANLAQIIEY